MIARLICLLTLAAAAPLSRAAAQESESPQPACKCSPELAGACFTVKGTISQHTRAPTVRIAVANSKRVLGLKGGVPEFLHEDFEVPGTVVTGEFLVCPLTKPKKGSIQLVCIESANNMVVSETR